MASEKAIEDKEGIEIDFSNVGLQLEDDSDETQKIILEEAPDSGKPADEERFMVLPRPPQERRVWKRFAIDGAVAMVMKPSLVNFLKPTYIKLGPVKDIGMKGLAIHYVDKKDDLNFQKAPYLSIALPGEGTVLDKLRFKIVNSFKVADLPGGKEVWNLCVTFDKLLPVQKVQLESFIDYYGNELKNNWAKKASGS